MAPPAAPGPRLLEGANERGELLEVDALIVLAEILAICLQESACRGRGSAEQVSNGLEQVRCCAPAEEQCLRPDAAMHGLSP
jgi:hypothetical protein